MHTLRITKEFRFEGAHALTDYDGKCCHIHGHSYILYVTVRGKASEDKASPKFGMLIDFKDLKSLVNTNIIDVYDHALVMREDSLLLNDIDKAYKNVVATPFQPTCENMISYFANILQDKLPENIELFSLKLHETASSYVEWYASDN